MLLNPFFNKGSNNIQVDYARNFADVLKGSMIKKIVDYKHNNTPYHGYLKDWDKSDVQRLLRKLVIEEYLREDLIFAKDIPQAYLYLGPKVAALMNENIKIHFSVLRKDSKSTVPSSSNDNIISKISNDTKCAPEVRQINERCYSDLLDLCRTIAAAKNVTMASIMNIQAIKAMAESLPETEEDMRSIPHVTKANFDKYGEKLLEITRNYAAEKLCLLMDMEDMNPIIEDVSAEADMPSTSKSAAAKNAQRLNLSNDDDFNWNAAASSQGSFSSSNRGGKRKRTWRGAGGKRYKKSTTTNWGGSTASPAKRAATKAKSFGSPKTARKKVLANRSSRGGTSSNSTSQSNAWIVKRNGNSSSGFQLMPIPGSK